jgi:succinoglycan biosynthesis transport protein ExoP
VSSPAVARLIGELRDRADYVLLDTPAMLPFGDAMAVGAIADAVIAVVRLNVARRPVLAELRRSLENVLAIKLGVVVTGVELEDEFAPTAYRRAKDRHPVARTAATSGRVDEPS